MNARTKSYQSFWPDYLAEHRSLGNRRLHFLGTGLAILFLVCAAVLGDLRFITAAIIAGYGFAWSGHRFVERNRPASFSHPYWSLFSDFRMFGLWLTGRLATEMKRHGLE